MQVGVVGAGKMGRGIAALAAQQFSVTLVDIDTKALHKAEHKIELYYTHLVKKNTISRNQAEKISQRITYTNDMQALAKKDIVIEAIFEKLALKRKLFLELDQLTDGVLATNTSCLTVGLIAKGLKKPQRVVGMHFFYPPTKNKLVELVKGPKTSPPTLRKARKFAELLGKTVIGLKDKPGFVGNRVLLVMLNEAARVYAENVADKEAIDTICTLGMAHPCGPLALIDKIGVDVVVKILDNLYAALKKPHFRPAPILRKMVKEGNLGKKTGKGFYTY